MSKLDIISLTFALLSLNYMINNEIEIKFFRYVLKVWILLLFIALVFVCN